MDALELSQRTKKAFCRLHSNIFVFFKIGVTSHFLAGFLFIGKNSRTSFEVHCSSIVKGEVTIEVLDLNTSVRHFIGKLPITNGYGEENTMKWPNLSSFCQKKRDITLFSFCVTVKDITPGILLPLQGQIPIGFFANVKIRNFDKGPFPVQISVPIELQLNHRNAIENPQVEGNSELPDDIVATATRLEMEMSEEQQNDPLLAHTYQTALDLATKTSLSLFGQDSERHSITLYKFAGYFYYLAEKLSIYDLEVIVITFKASGYLLDSLENLSVLASHCSISLSVDMDEYLKSLMKELDRCPMIATPTEILIEEFKKHSCTPTEKEIALNCINSLLPNSLVEPTVEYAQMCAKAALLATRKLVQQNEELDPLAYLANQMVDCFQSNVVKYLKK